MIKKLAHIPVVQWQRNLSNPVSLRLAGNMQQKLQPGNYQFCRRTIAGSSPQSTGAGTIKIDEHSLQTKEAVENFLGHLSIQQKTLLFSQLNLNILAYKRKHGEPGHEIHHFLSKYGRPTTYNDGADDTKLESTDDAYLSSGSAVGESAKLNAEETQQVPASRRDIYSVGLNNALPFVGFGFLDNFIMIVAGDYIDVTFASLLGISTMAAAALGNTISDIAGIGSAWYIEYYAEKFGMYTPKLTEFQANSWQIRWSTNLGRAIGVTVGCLLGMIPLLFLPLSGKSAQKEDKEIKKLKSD